jgi:thioredoxin-like negative regulator of GroEL
MSIPTMILFNAGNEVDRIIGAVPEEAVRDFLSK